MGGSVSVTSGATGQALAPAPTGVSYATGSP
jgi:hypothetical protein